MQKMPCKAWGNMMPVFNKNTYFSVMVPINVMNYILKRYFKVSDVTYFTSISRVVSEILGNKFGENLCRKCKKTS